MYKNCIIITFKTFRIQGACPLNYVVMMPKSSEFKTHSKWCFVI